MSIHVGLLNLANDCSFSRCAFALSWLALATAGSILQKSTEREWWGCRGGRKVKARLSCLDAYNFPKNSRRQIYEFHQQKIEKTLGEGHFSLGMDGLTLGAFWGGPIKPAPSDP